VNSTGLCARLAFAAALALACACLWPSASEAFVGCARSGTTLAVFATTEDDQVRIIRGGDAINLVAGDEYGDSEILLACSGGAATVTNTDTITIEDGSLFGVQIDLSNGQFAPGATAEPDGASEIEFKATTAAKFEVLSVVGSPGADTIDLGRTTTGRLGVNLNPAAEAGSPDPDLEFDGPGIPLISGRRGADVIRGQGVGGFAGPYDTRLVAAGGAGGDVIAGGTGSNVLLGGDGRDRLFGSNRRDVLLPEGGRDRAFTGGGNDLVYAEEDGRDKINCAGGRDLAVLDPGDKGRSCRRGGERELVKKLGRNNFLFLSLGFFSEEDEEEGD
jgi:Ca2+-binding RTX toxin-like protein